MQNNKILKNLLALSLVRGLGAFRINSFTKNKEHIERVFDFSKKELKKFEGIGYLSAKEIHSFKNWDEVDDILVKTEKIGAKIITIFDEEYPLYLKHIYSPPAFFWLKGDANVLNKQSIAVIGTRKPTQYGKKMAAKITAQLAEEGLCVVSGLAYGIDAIAHKAALDAEGTTIAVLGSGIDNIYPKKHASLAQRIVENGGAVITEFPPGAAPDAGNFPVRNRIVSGMSLGVLVVESGVQGGSMITAELGLDQNREIFALPHNMDNLSGTGGNYLIKTGAAKLVQNIQDILNEIAFEGKAETEIKTDTKSIIPKPKRWEEMNLDPISVSICELLQENPVQVDDIGEKLNMPTSKLLVSLLQLEMKGLVQQQAGKHFKLI